jgi:peptidoglycan/xylan/chitin deacetylase (PgdA/CDA1 family)
MKILFNYVKHESERRMHMQFLTRHKRLAFFILFFFIVFIIKYPVHLFTTKIYYRDGVSILIYHDIDNKRQGGVTISTSLFKKQLLFLKGKRFTFITYQQYKQFLTGSEVPPNAVLVTFDDGYESYYTNAYPILKSMSVPSVQFVITKRLKNPQRNYIPSLSENEIRDITTKEDLVEVQTHTDNLHSKQNNNAYLTNRLIINGLEETELDYEQRVVSDIRKSISSLRGLQDYPVDSLAYPFGIYSPKAIDLIKQSGIQFAYTVQSGISYRDADHFQLPRINAGSPWITPEYLLVTIETQTLKFKKPHGFIPIRSALEQVGGTVEADMKGNITIFFGHQKWTITTNRCAVNQNGQSFKLLKPLKKKFGKNFIFYPDFQKLFGSTVIYNKSKQRFYSDPSLTME